MSLFPTQLNRSSLSAPTATDASKKADIKSDVKSDIKSDIRPDIKLGNKSISGLTFIFFIRIWKEWLLRPLQIVYTVYALLSFALIILMLAPFVILFLPLGRIRGGNIMYGLFRIMGYVWLLVIGIRHKTTYRPTLDLDQQYIFVANHISYIDAVTIICSIKHHFRPIGKHELLHLPVFNIIYSFCVITVNRTNAADRARSLADLRKILAKGISIVVFPEGTFNMGDKPMGACYDGAFKLAVETGKQIQPIVFPDALDRLHYRSVFSLTPGWSRALYLDPIDPLAYPHLDHKGLKALAVERMSRQLIASKASWIADRYLHHVETSIAPSALPNSDQLQDLVRQPYPATPNVLRKTPKST